MNKVKKIKYKVITCPRCEGTGVNHYDDNNPCLYCEGDGTIKTVNLLSEAKK